MFCPQCKAEYRVGFTRCWDCHVDLVEHLRVEPVTAPTVTRHFEADPFGPEPKLVVIRTYQRGVDADLAKSVLEAAAIPSMIRGDAGQRYYYGYGLALRTGIELLVRADDAEDADKILDVDATDVAERE